MLILNTQGKWNVITLVFNLTMYVIGALATTFFLLSDFPQYPIRTFVFLLFVGVGGVSTIRGLVFYTRVLSDKNVNTHLL